MNTHAVDIITKEVSQSVLEKRKSPHYHDKEKGCEIVPIVRVVGKDEEGEDKYVSKGSKCLRHPKAKLCGGCGWEVKFHLLAYE